MAGSENFHTLIHISDTHFSVDTSAPYEAATSAVMRINALPLSPAAVIVTGDIADHGLVEEYEQASKVLGALHAPVLLLPGNHDVTATMAHELSDDLFIGQAHNDGKFYGQRAFASFDVLCCDSSIAGKHYGILGDRQLAWIQSEVSQDTNKPVFIALHHHVIPSGIE